MNKTQSLHIRGAVLVGLSCLAVAACSPKQGEFGDQLFPHGKWEQIPPAPDNMVEIITLRHAVAFANGQAGLGMTEQSDLTNFIRENRIAAADEIVVQAAGGDRDRLMVGRLTAVKAEFARHGLVAAEALVSPASSTAAVPGEVAVLITRAVVIPPDCSVPQPEPGLRPEMPWGCHVNTALGMMVANPLDLVEGRDLGPGDGEQASAAMRRYRTDKVKKFEREDTDK